MLFLNHKINQKPHKNLSKDDFLNRELQKSIDIKEAAEKMLKLSSCPSQTLNIYKTILVANARIYNFMSMLQRENESINKQQSPKCLGTSSNSRDVPLAKLCIEKIRIPLIWPSSTRSLVTSDNLEGISSRLPNDSSGRMSFFCVFQIGNIIKETELISDVAPGTVDLEFDDVIVFDDVSSDFVLVVEIYSHESNMSRGPSLRKNFRQKITNSFVHIGNKENFREPNQFHVPNPFHKSYYQTIVDNSIRKKQVYAITTKASNVNSCFKLLGRVLITKDQLSYQKKSSFMIDTGYRLNYSLWPTREEILAGKATNNTIYMDENVLEDGGKPLFGVFGAKIYAQVQPSAKTTISGHLNLSILKINKIENAEKKYFVLLSNCSLQVFDPASLHHSVDLHSSLNEDDAVIEIAINKKTEIFFRYPEIDSINQDLISDRCKTRPCIDIISTVKLRQGSEPVVNTGVEENVYNPSDNLTLVRVEAVNDNQSAVIDVDEETKVLRKWFTTINQHIDEQERTSDVVK